jgi:hypothetical protein
MKSSIFGYAGVLVGLCGALGCSMDVGEEAAEDVSTSQEAAATTSTASDPTGTVTISYTRCDANTGAGIRIASCKVPTDFVLVGGGAEIIDSPEPGALLMGSFPEESNQQWVARAKDHNGLPQSYSLRAHAIGLKIKNLGAADLRNLVKIHSPHKTRTSTSGTLSDSVPIPQQPPGSTPRMVLGGGVDNVSDFAAQGRLLVASAPVCNNNVNDACNPGATVTGWFGFSKDHFTPAAGNMFTYLITMPECFSVQGTQKCFKNTVAHASSVFSGGYQNTFIENIGPVSGAGGYVEYNGDGRMLTDIFPSRRSSGVRVYAESKDHVTTSKGVTIAYAVGLLPR